MQTSNKQNKTLSTNLKTVTPTLLHFPLSTHSNAFPTHYPILLLLSLIPLLLSLLLMLLLLET